MITIKEAADQVAKKHHYDDFNHACRSLSDKDLWPEITKLYAEELQFSVESLSGAILSAEAENDKLKKFKQYVHGRLDKMGIPSNPEPENNASHGCRIEGRLNFIENKLKKATEK